MLKYLFLSLWVCGLSNLFAQDIDVNVLTTCAMKVADDYRAVSILPNGNSIVFWREFGGNGGTQNTACVAEFDSNGAPLGEYKRKESSQLSKKDKYGGQFMRNGLINIIFYDMEEKDIRLHFFIVESAKSFTEVGDVVIKNTKDFFLERAALSPDEKHLAIMNGQTHGVLILDENYTKESQIVWQKTTPAFQLYDFVVTDQGFFAGLVMEGDPKRTPQYSIRLLSGSVGSDELKEQENIKLDQLGAIAKGASKLIVHSNNTVIMAIIGGDVYGYSMAGPMIYRVIDISTNKEITSTVVPLDVLGFGKNVLQVNIQETFLKGNFINFAIPVSPNSILLGMPAFTGDAFGKTNFEDNFVLLEIDFSGEVIQHYTIMEQTSKKVKCFVQPIISNGEVNLICSIEGEGVPSKEISKVSSYDLLETKTYYLKYERDGKLKPTSPKFKEHGFTIESNLFINDGVNIVLSKTDKKMGKLFMIK